MTFGFGFDELKITNLSSECRKRIAWNAHQLMAISTWHKTQLVELIACTSAMVFRHLNVQPDAGRRCVLYLQRCTGLWNSKNSFCTRHRKRMLENVFRLFRERAHEDLPFFFSRRAVTGLRNTLTTNREHQMAYKKTSFVAYNISHSYSVRCCAKLVRTEYARQSISCARAYHFKTKPSLFFSSSIRCVPVFRCSLFARQLNWGRFRSHTVECESSCRTAALSHHTHTARVHSLFHLIADRPHSFRQD